jgi:hypothetical protein
MVRPRPNYCFGHNRQSQHNFCGRDCIEEFERQQGIRLPEEQRIALINAFSDGEAPTPPIPQVPTSPTPIDESEESTQGVDEPTLQLSDLIVEYPVVTASKMQVPASQGHYIMLHLKNGGMVVVSMKTEEEVDNLLMQVERKETVWFDMTG